jgi:beta-lactamase class D
MMRGSGSPVPGRRGPIAALFRLLGAIGVASAAACTSTPAVDALAAGDRTGAAPSSARLHVDLHRHFQPFGAEGAFVLYDAAQDRHVVFRPDQAERRFLPASTFKILNSLIALEVGAIADQHEIVPWDGVDRGEWWNGDQALTRAFQRSSVWVYQELARRIGEARMAEWVQRVGYGNAELGGGIDRFWLEGALRISADEQIEFLRRLHAGTLPFSERSQSIVRDLMLFEERDEYVIRAKTGWARHEGMQFGWLVGWVERGENTYFFATQIQSADPEIPMQRAQREITRGALRELGVLPARETDLGVGVVGFARPVADTLRIRAEPDASAPVLTELRRPHDGPYQLAARDVAPHLVEYAYEVSGLPFDSVAGHWARVVYGYRLDEALLRGWIHLSDPRVFHAPWSELLLRKSVTFRLGAPAELHASFGGPRLEEPGLAPYLAGMDYDLDPVRAEGSWLLVRMRAPSACSAEQAAIETTAWVRHLTADGRPLVAPSTRGC